MNEIEEIKSRIDLVDLISQYVTLKKAGTNYKGVCPFHQEKTPSFMVSPEKQIWKCFGCGRGGDHYAFIREAEHLEFGDALRLLANRAGVTLQSQTKTEHQTRDRKEVLYKVNDLSARVFHKILLEQDVAKPAREYLKKRGVDEKTFKQFRLGFAPKKFDLRRFLLKHGYIAADVAKAGNPDKFYDRIIFPIFDVLGNVIAFTGRSLGDAQPKYLNSPDSPLFNKSRILYGLNFAKGAIKEKNYVVFVEGQMDVVALHQHGVAQTVASSGTAITELQVQLLSKYTQNFLLAFDNDGAGRQTTKKVIELLLKFDLNSKVIDFGAYKDAGEMFEKEPAAWSKAVKEAPEGVDWWINQAMAEVGDVKFVENKKQVIKTMLPLLELVTEPTRLDHYLQRLSLALEVKTESVYEALARARSKTATPVAPQTAERVQLTNEEQLLALLLSKPALLSNRQAKLAEVVWQSDTAARIGELIKKEYNKETLTKPSVFLSQVKSSLDSQIAGKIDSWLFWISSQWPELSTELAGELADEKLAQLATKKYESRKEQLAFAIKRAQEKGDISQVKELMGQLNTLTKERG